MTDMFKEFWPVLLTISATIGIVWPVARYWSGNATRKYVDAKVEAATIDRQAIREEIRAQVVMCRSEREKDQKTLREVVEALSDRLGKAMESLARIEGYLQRQREGQA